jgi:hypothetical protein
MSLGGERCSYDAHHLYMWLALDGGFGWPGDSWAAEIMDGSIGVATECGTLCSKWPSFLMVLTMSARQRILQILH